jgi:signal transduction histidine kinase
MKKSFWDEYETSPRGIISPHIIIPLAVAGIIIIVISIYFEYNFRKKEYLTLLNNQAKLFISTLVNLGQNTLQAADALETEIEQRMLSNLQLISALNELTPFTKKTLKEQQLKSQFDRLDIYNKNGKLVVSVSDSSSEKEKIPSDILSAVNEGILDEIILTSEDTTATLSGRFITLVHSRKGGSVVGMVNAESIQTFRNLYGFGRFFKEFKKTESVEYVVLQNPETIIAGTFQPYKLSTFNDDKFLKETYNQNEVKTRIISYNKKSIYESTVPFIIDKEPIGILRLGLSMEIYEQLNSKVKKRFIISGILVLIMSVALLSFYLSHKHRQILREGFIQLQQYTNVILENIGSGIITIANNGIIQLINKQASAILKKNKEDIIGYNVDTLPNEIFQICRESISNEKEILQPYYIWLQEGANLQQLSLRTTLLKRNSIMETCILLIDDTTEQARLEEQLRRQEKLTAMGKLASSVAHEIRNPLNSIGLIIQRLGKIFSTSEDYSKLFQTVENEIFRINDIVSEFIKFARPQQINKKPLNFMTFFNEIETLFQSKLQENQIKFELDIQPHPNFSGDYNQLKQVFINLMENSIQAITPPGSIIIKGKHYDNYYEIKLQDTGSGIPEKDIPHIFDINFTTKKGGTGVGLAIVHQIIYGHNGSITVESKLSSGTTFTVNLPYC